MAQMATHGCPADSNELTYFVRMEKIVAHEAGQGTPHRICAVFAMLPRHGSRVTDDLRIHANQLVDIGRQISI